MWIWGETKSKIFIFIVLSRICFMYNTVMWKKKKNHFNNNSSKYNNNSILILSAAAVEEVPGRVLEGWY